MNPFDKYSGDVLVTLRENSALTTSTATIATDKNLALSNSNFGSIGTNIKFFLEVPALSAGTIEILSVEFDNTTAFSGDNLVTFNASNYKTSIYSNDRNSETEPFVQTKISTVANDQKSAIAISNLQNPGHKYVRVNVKTVGFTGTYRVSAIVESSKDPVKQV